MAETLVIDPTSEDATNTPLTLTTGSYGLTEHRYPEPPIDVQWASSVSTEGEVPASRRRQNRQIPISVEVDCTSSLTPLRTLQAKLTKLAGDGSLTSVTGTLQRTMSDGTVITFDVLTSGGYDPSFDQTWHLGSITTVSFTLTCKPFGRGPEITLSDHVETTLPVLTFTETTLKGDVPAFGRLVIDNDQAATAMGMVLWGLESRYYNASAPLYYEAEACVVNGTVITGPTGASGSSVAHSQSLVAGSWTQTITVGPSATAQPHVGTFRVLARVQAPNTNTGTVQLRLTWAPTPNGAVAHNTPAVISDTVGPVEAAWVLADLGLVTLPKALVGTQGWIGYIEATSATSDRVDTDYVMLLPVAEGAGQMRATVASGQSVVIRSDGTRVSASTGYWSDPASYSGDLLLVPPGTTRIMVKTSRASAVAGPNGMNTSGTGSADAGVDDVSAKLFYTPRYLAVPGA